MKWIPWNLNVLKQLEDIVANLKGLQQRLKDMFHGYKSKDVSNSTHSVLWDRRRVSLKQSQVHRYHCRRHIHNRCHLCPVLQDRSLVRSREGYLWPCVDVCCRWFHGHLYAIGLLVKGFLNAKQIHVIQISSILKRSLQNYRFKNIFRVRENSLERGGGFRWEMLYGHFFITH